MIESIFFLFLISFVILIFLNNIAYKLNFLDLPSKRKIHKKPTPYVGGLMIGLVYLISYLIFDFENYNFSLILIFGFIISIVGFIDDKINLNVISKLFFQSTPILILIFNYDFVVYELGDFKNFSIQLGIFAYIFTLLAVFLLINANNYIDGVDGFAGILFISSIFLIFFNLKDINNSTLFYFLVITVPVIVFLFFNLSLLKLPKVFLGDSGSLLLGFILSFTLIISNKFLDIHPVKLAWSVPLIVYDFLSINILRLIERKNIFSPEKKHIQHLILSKTNSVYLTNIIGFLMNLLMGMFGLIIFYFFSKLLSIIFFIILFFIYLVIRIYFSRLIKVK